MNSQSSIVNGQCVLSIDPSSTVIGWANMVSATRLVEAGLIRPDSSRDDSYKRIGMMCRDLRELLDQVRPAVILVEWTRGKVGRRRHQGLGAGLAVYGCGVGAAARECEHWAADPRNSRLVTGRLNKTHVVPILENTWTRGVPKRDRQLAIASMFDDYHITADPGADISDAIGMAVWWFRRKSLFNH